MNKKVLTLIMVSLIGLIFLSSGLLSAADKAATEAPDEIVIETEGYKKDKKGPVKFHHKKHQEEYLDVEGKKIDCTECHHKYVDGKNVWKKGDPVAKCGSEDCHSPLKKKGKKQYALAVAFHKNCKDCHKALVEAGKKKEKEAPYKKCNTCMKPGSK